MKTNNDKLLIQWNEVKDQVRHKWGKLTEDDLTRMSGKTDELTGVLQQRYGYGKAQAELEIKDWLHTHGSSGKKENKDG